MHILYSIYATHCPIMIAQRTVYAMHIRNMRAADYPVIDKLLLQIHHVDVVGRPEFFFPIEQYMTRDSFESLVTNKNIISILAQERGQVVGCCFVSMLERSGMATMKSAYIDLLVVDEKHRHQGIGRALFREVRRRAKKLGAKRVDLMVWSHNDIAIRAYESYGMTPQRCVYEINI